VLPVLLFACYSFAVGAQGRPDGQTVETFFNAIAMNDTNTAAQLLEGNTNLVYAVDNLTKLPLLEAAAAGNAELVKRLLELGADINAQGDTLGSGGSQRTALHFAVQRNHLEVCLVLLQAGADPNRMAFGFETPLHLAFKEQREEIAGLLLDYGAEPFQGKLYSNNETTPFEMAVTSSSGRLVPRMLGQDPEHPLGTKSLQIPRRSKLPPRGVKTSAEILSQHGNELIVAAVQRGEVEAVQALIRADVSIKNANTNCPTILQSFAISANEVSRNLPATVEQWHRVQDQLKADYIPKADPSFVSSLRMQEASLAAKVETMAPQRWQQLLEVLIQRGAEYDVFAATALGDTNRVNQLVSVGKNAAQARDCNGQTPLHWAIQSDHPQMVAFWIAAGTPLTATNSDGQTALHLAVTAGKLVFVKTLLAAQALTDIRDTNGWTPVDVAIQAHQPETIRLFMKDNTAVQTSERAIATPLHEAAASGNIAVLAVLTETATNLEPRNELGLTPLQVAVQRGHLAAAALLVDKGADVTARDAEGNSLLHQILLEDRLTVYDRPPTSWLERMGPDPRKATYVRYLTVGQYEQGPNPVLQATSFLLACGVDAKATNNAGETAIQLVTEEKISRGIFFFEDDQAQLLKLLGDAGGSFDAADADGNTSLHRLAHGFFTIEAQDSISGLIASGANINAKNKQGQTPLHMTIQPDYIWISWMKMLLAAHADLNAQDTNGFTPLHLLALSKAHYGQSEAAALLIEAGAKPDVLDKQGRTPLLLTKDSPASSWEINAFVQTLLKAGAKTNGKDDQGRTVAHLALMGQWPWSSAGEELAALAKAGADFSAKDDQGKTPLHYLAGLGSQSPMFFIRGVGDAFVAARVDFQARDNEGNTPLHVAAKTGTRDVFDWLVKQGANLDATNNLGETARLLAAHSKDAFPRSGPANAETDIFQAIREGNIDAATRLLNADPQLANQTNQLQQTPLRVAVMLHQTNLVSFLESHGAIWDEGSAVLAGRTDVLETILQQKPTASSTMVMGKGLIHIAAANGNVPMVKLLIESNCDLQAKDSWGLSPLGYALIKHHRDVQETLLAHGAKENFFDAVYANDLKAVTAQLAQDKTLAASMNSQRISVTDVATAAGHVDILKLLLKNGANFNFQSNTNGRNPVHMAAFYDQPEALALLIRAGAKVDQVDWHGLAPLHWATIRNATNAAVWLLKHEANANQALTPVEPGRDFMMMGPDRGAFIGDTPPHLAAMSGETNMVQLLLKSGADVNAVNERQQTPLDLAGGMQPMNPFEIIMLERSMLGLLEPLGVTPTRAAQFQAIRERRNAVAEMIKAAGGEHSQNGQQPGARWMR